MHLLDEAVGPDLIREGIPASRTGAQCLPPYQSGSALDNGNPETEGAAVVQGADSGAVPKQWNLKRVTGGQPQHPELVRQCDASAATPHGDNVGREPQRQEES
ncbi:hypothetical protein [Glycomyces sp. NPDC047010]|uniref:hypothetical protein n=1 Tax=Glycomyces sp. NPDC047010 TaxID=3155023 RepID=UPI003404C117